MFIKTLDNKKLLNTAQITSFEIVEPKHDLKKYLICANMFRDGGIIAEAETEDLINKKLQYVGFTYQKHQTKNLKEKQR